MTCRTVKSRLIVWICAFTCVCVLSVMALLLIEAHRLEITRAQSRMEDAARDAADEVEYGDDGRLTIDDDIVYYRDEVTVFVLDDELNLISGRIPAGFVNDAPIARDKTRTLGEWMVLDMESDEPSLIIRAIYSLNEINENMNALILTSAAVFAGFVCVLATVSLIIAKRAFGPLFAINAALKAAKPGSEGERIVLKNAAQEFNELAVNVNKLLDRVETSFAAERRFTADVSHELRTPLGIMLSNIEYAMARPDDRQVNAAAISECHAQVNRMIALVTGLLMIARADSGRISLNRENVDLSGLCEMALEQQRETALSRGVELISDIELGLEVYGDETMLLVCVTNLLDNALKYHRESGSGRYIKLSLRNEGGRKSITVADNGRGIPEEQLEAVWDRFHRVDTAKDSKEGTGLGLSIVKLLVQAHAGECMAECDDGETRFVIRI